MNLSEDDKEILRDLVNSPAWKLFENFATKQINELRVLACQRAVSTEDLFKLQWNSAEASGRENLITSFKDLIQ